MSQITFERVQELEAEIERLRARLAQLGESPPRALLAAYAAAVPHIDALEPRENAAPKAFAALRAVLDYTYEVEHTLPIAALTIRSRITAALEAK